MISAGDKLGRYKIRSAIGKGGMGEVWLADDTELARKQYQSFVREQC